MSTEKEHCNVIPLFGGIFLSPEFQTPEWLISKINQRHAIMEASEVSNVVISGLKNYALERYRNFTFWYIQNHKSGVDTTYSEKVVGHANGLMELANKAEDLKSSVHRRANACAKLIIRCTNSTEFAIGDHTYKTIDVHERTYLARLHEMHKPERLHVFNINYELTDDSLSFASFEDQCSLILDIESERTRS